MFGAELICSDETCAEVTEVNVFSLAELDVLTCDGCGCTLQTLNVWEVRVVGPFTRRGRRYYLDGLPRAA